MKVRRKWQRVLAAVSSMILTVSLLLGGVQQCLAGEGALEAADSGDYAAPVKYLTVQYVDATGSKLFHDKTYEIIKQNGRYTADLTACNDNAADWYAVAFKDSNGEKIKDPTAYNMKGKDRTVTIVLEAQKTVMLNGDTMFYDYAVAPYTGNKYNPFLGQYEIHPEKSINTAANYSDPDSGNRLSAGTGKNQDWSQNYPENQYEAWTNGLDANVFQGDRVTYGIVAGLSDDYSDVLFNFDEPGFFSSQPKIGKTILQDYKLQFEKSGYTYRLAAVLDENGMETTKSGPDFWPLDHLSTDWQMDNRDGNGSAHNHYFGMRYDISFTLGDYAGPLTYSFSGDDDAWVLLDGELVLDIGGIHNTVSRSVNLREYDAIKNSSPDTVHNLTVLYMERGANASNCTMSFVIPNAEIKRVPTADLSFQKTDAESGAALSGAIFRLAHDSNAMQTYEAVSGADGTVTFKGLTAGTYTLTETAAPSGYEAAKNSWKVLVSPSGKYTVTAELFEADGVTPVAQGQITNVRDNAGRQPSVQDVIQDKTAKLLDWDERTYRIDLYAAHNFAVSSPVALVMALDISGSMAWFTTAPTGGTTRLSGLNAADREKQRLERGGSTGTQAWNYTYYVLRKGEGNAYEYQPVGYDPGDGKWKCIKSKSTGEKIFEKNASGLVSSDEQIYIRGKNDHTKFEALVVSVRKFMDNLKAVSPDSQVGFVLFAGENKKSVGLTNVGGINLDTLFDVPLYGGTNQGAALAAARQMVEDAPETDRNILLFSDGAPNAENVTGDSIRQTAESAKAAGIVLYTAGIFQDSGNEGYRGLSEWASPDCAFLTATAEELINVFDTVFAKINASLTGVLIRDYIDSRFILTDSAGAPLNEGDTVNGGTVGYDSGRGLYYVVWENQTLGYAPDPESGWHQALYVRAKDAFIGGNNVPTNAPESGITVEGTVKPFDRPVVNVNTRLLLQDVREVIFYGEASAGLNEVLAKMVSDGTYRIGEDGAPIDPAQDFQVLWFAEETCTTAISADEIFKNNARYIDATYYGKVAYRVSEPTEESLKNTQGLSATGTGVNRDDASRENAAYGLRTVKGEIDLVKIIDRQYTDIAQIYANQTFIFKIEQYEAVDSADGSSEKGPLAAVFYATIGFDSNGNVTSGSSKICGLKKGYYTVTEESGWSASYGLTAVTDNNEAGKAGGVDLFVGRKTNNAGLNEKPWYYGLETFHTASRGPLYLAAADGVEAVVTFTGKKDPMWQWLSDAASAVNRFLRPTQSPGAAG